jgi:hypothetical protein
MDLAWPHAQRAIHDLDSASILAAHFAGSSAMKNF